MLICNCWFGVAGLGPDVAVPVADTVIADVPGGVLGPGVGVGVGGGGGGGVPPPPQLMTATNSRIDIPRAIARRRLMGAINTIPTASNPAPQAMAFRRCSGRTRPGESNCAFGPVVFTINVASPLVSAVPTSSCAGRKVHVVSGGNGPQLKLILPLKPLRDDAPILNAADWPARMVRKELFAAMA